MDLKKLASNSVGLNSVYFHFKERLCFNGNHNQTRRRISLRTIRQSFLHIRTEFPLQTILRQELLALTHREEAKIPIPKIRSHSPLPEF